MGAPSPSRPDASPRVATGALQPRKAFTMRFTSASTSADGTTSREFVHDGVPGVLWTPPGDPAGLVLGAHGGGQHTRSPGVVARAHRCTAAGLAVVTLDSPAHGDRA